MALPMWMGIIQSVECLNRTKSWRKAEFALSLLEVRHSSSLSTLGSQDFGFRLGFTLSGSKLRTSG